LLVSSRHSTDAIEISADESSITASGAAEAATMHIAAKGKLAVQFAESSTAQDASAYTSYQPQARICGASATPTTISSSYDITTTLAVNMHTIHAPPSVTPTQSITIPDQLVSDPVGPPIQTVPSTGEASASELLIKELAEVEVSDTSDLALETGSTIPTKGVTKDVTESSEPGLLSAYICLYFYLTILKHR
jgi:hypothetical protein